MVGQASTRAYGYFYVLALLAPSTPIGIGSACRRADLAAHEDSSAAPAMNSGRRGLSASRARDRPASGRRRSSSGWPTGRALAVRSWPESGAAPLGWHQCEVECPQGQSTRYPAALGRRLGALAATLRWTRARRPARERSATSSPRPEAPAPPRAANRPDRRAHSQDHARRRATGVVGAPRPTRYVVALPCHRASQGQVRTPMGPIVQPARVRRRRLGRMRGSTHRQRRPLQRSLGDAVPQTTPGAHDLAPALPATRRRRVRLEHRG